RDNVTRQIGDYYAACMDDKGIDARGLAPLTAEFDRIRQLSDKSQLAGEIAHLHRIGVAALFEFGSGQDFKDSTAVVAQLDQGGIGMPDRDYYLKDDPKSVELRQKYVAHVQRMFELAGRNPETARAYAATVMRMETELAKGSQDNVAFYGRTLTGAKEMRPRWKRCVEFTDNQLGEALGKKYVEKTFGTAGKERTLKMVYALEKSLGEDIDKLPWMTAATKKEALVKLQAITNKIGYPDNWRDYSRVEIKRDDAIGNGFRADQFEFQRQLDKIGKPVDRLEWSMTPPTVNAYTVGGVMLH